MLWRLARSHSEVVTMIKRIEADAIIFSDVSGDILTMNEIKTDSGIVIAFCGELRSEIARDLHAELETIVSVNIPIELDFAKVTYIASSIQGVLLHVQQKIDELKKSAMVLRNVPSSILNEFENTGIIDCLNVD